MAGGGLGSWPAVAMAVFASLAVLFPMICAATSHTVGGSTGWTIPPNPSFYPNWSAAQKFGVGDTLVFNFTTGAHTVVEVPKSSYDACSTKNQVGPTQSTGPATVTINSAGTHYYICSVTGHCSLNQKLSITVSGGSPTTPSTPPVPSNSPGDSSSPTPPPTAGGPSGSPSGSGSSAAQPASMVGIAAAAAAGLLLAVALW
ncbi:hypothetical protein IEQ34_020829 [Dendrobium chrysotoxum]|uniref:Phytocyanin domain-containing protein n=1 Tax=Dendrobium chrysotoxum TaxID=161865 RepID=A0AAV7G3U1_DENCH|nr:hypothetical protein IEQ34_020829 [Dendrobium chrysotoxum]